MPINTHSPSFPFCPVRPVMGTVSQGKKKKKKSMAWLASVSSQWSAPGWQASYGSQHHQLCHQDLPFLIQTHVTPSHSWPTSKSPFTPFLPTMSLLHSYKLLRESSAWLLHIAFMLPKLHGKESPKTSWLAPTQLWHLGLFIYLLIYLF